MGTLDSREYDRLVKRNFAPYSKGHRAMYEIATGRLIASKRRIFEAGFGIGWGLDYMLAAGIVAEYTGCEPNEDSFNYVDKRLGVDPRVNLVNIPFGEDAFHQLFDTEAPPFDVAFCIEVIEHVPMDRQADFLKYLHDMAPRLFFSTPDMHKVPKEGVRTTDKWAQMLSDSGWDEIHIDTRNWTHLFDCS